jgi:hypothetical protein
MYILVILALLFPVTLSPGIVSSEAAEIATESVWAESRQSFVARKTPRPVLFVNSIFQPVFFQFTSSSTKLSSNANILPNDLPSYLRFRKLLI